MSRTVVLAHHKSGTYVSWAIYGSLCCPPLLRVETHKIVTRFLRLWPNASVCVTRNVTVELVGLPDLHYDPSSRVTIVHLRRHPVDMIVSGYLYHRACKERGWTDRLGWTNPVTDHPEVAASLRSWFGYPGQRAHVGALLNASNQSFCKALQHGLERCGATGIMEPISCGTGNWGLHAEAFRSLVASNGVGRMLEVEARLQSDAFLADPRRRALPVCMSDYTLGRGRARGRERNLAGVSP